MVRPLDHEGRGRNHFSTDAVKGSGAKMCHRQNRLLVEQLAAQLLIGGEEHPALHGDHGDQPTECDQVQITFDEHGKQVGLAVGIIVSRKVAQFLVHPLATHVGRIGDDYMVMTSQIL